eukprot:m.148599 g.148599  ORF g.148599 m.148599 type:complete len:77 (+) comp15001_c0_seq8:182-412(+)
MGKSKKRKHNKMGGVNIQTIPSSISSDELFTKEELSIAAQVLNAMAVDPFAFRGKEYRDIRVHQVYEHIVCMNFQL